MATTADARSCRLCGWELNLKQWFLQLELWNSAQETVAHICRDQWVHIGESHTSLSGESQLLMLIVVAYPLRFLVAKLCVSFSGQMASNQPE